MQLIKKFFKMQNNQHRNWEYISENCKDWIIFLKIVPFIVLGISCICNLFRIEEYFSVFNPQKSDTYFLSLLFLPFMVSFQITSIILFLLSFFMPKQGTVLEQDEHTYLSCVNIGQHGIKYFVLSTLWVIYFLYCG
jgi:hypothetical protein